jgi:hypothetical protein
MKLRIDLLEDEGSIKNLVDRLVSFVLSVAKKDGFFNPPTKYTFKLASIFLHLEIC